MSPASPATPSEAVLAIDHLTIAFAGGPPVVDDLTLRVPAGRVVALVGGSGSGKSVTAMSVLGLLPGSARVAGSIRVRDDELVGAPPERLRHVRGGEVGMVFQEPSSSFNPVLTLGAQIAEAVREHSPRASADDVEARVREGLASVGIDDVGRVASSFPHQLSGGQLQRAMIAMALSADPAVLIADEPTTALDVTVQAGILDLLRTLCRERDVAVLLITHDMGVVADVADEVVVIHEGRRVEVGEVDRVFAHPGDAYTRQLLDGVPRLDEVRERPRAAVPTPGGEAPGVGTAPPAALLREACISYGRRGRRGVMAVDGVSLQVPAGGVLGLVGESGSGKSTVGRALAGLIPLVSGDVEVGGLSLRSATRRELRRARASLGYVFQDPASTLNPRATVGWSVTEPLRVHGDLAGGALRTRAAQLLDAVQLAAAYADRHPHELSGGQRQRVAIARALALQPTLLIADEPTSALDVTVQAAVLDLLSSLQRDLGFACLFISHDLAVVRQVADEVAVMRRGRLVEHGGVDVVLSAPAASYTRTLLAAAPVPDPPRQRQRREAWRELVAAQREDG